MLATTSSGRSVTFSLNFEADLGAAAAIPGEAAGFVSRPLETSFLETTNELWPPVLCYVLVASVIFVVAGFQLADPALPAIFALYGLGGIASWAYTRRARLRRLALAATAVFQLGAISIAGMMLTYAAAAIGRPLVDEPLLLFDHLAGYNWRDYAAFIHSRPVLMFVAAKTYSQIFFMPPIAACALAAVGDARRIRQYIVATTIALTVASIMFGLWPALTAWAHLESGAGDITQYTLLPTTSAGWEHDLLEIRAGRGFIVRTFGSGLIAFPSFHCVAGILFCWGLWPIRRSRLPTLVASGTMIAAAPILGGHYLADLVAGAVVSVASVVFAVKVEPMFRTRATRRRVR